MNSTTGEPPGGSSQQPSVPLEERGIYRIHSRNLTLSVYDGKGGFIGIREKFGVLYLFTEYAWEQGPPYGTVKVESREHVGWCPPEIPLTETLGTKCAGCHEKISFNGEVMQWVGCQCSSVRATAIPNHKLFSLLGGMATPEEQESWETQARVWSRRAAVPTRSSTRGGTPSTQAGEGEGEGESPPDSP